MRIIKNAILIIIFTVLFLVFILPMILVSIGSVEKNNPEVQKAKEHYLKVMKNP